MITPSRIAPGQPVRLTATFVDPATGNLVDPDTLEFDLRKPDFTKQTFIYLTDFDVVKETTGLYHIDVTPDMPGRWHFRWVSTGIAAGATEDFFVVQKSRFVHDPDCYWDYW